MQMITQICLTFFYLFSLNFFQREQQMEVDNQILLIQLFLNWKLNYLKFIFWRHIKIIITSLLFCHNFRVIWRFWTGSKIRARWLTTV